MARLITYSFRCEPECGHADSKLFRLDADEDPPDMLNCPECDSFTWKRVPHINPMVASYPDGTKRFDDVRAYRTVEKEMKKARRQRKDTTAHRAEMEKIGGMQKRNIQKK